MNFTSMLAIVGKDLYAVIIAVVFIAWGTYQLKSVNQNTKDNATDIKLLETRVAQIEAEQARTSANIDNIHNSLKEITDKLSSIYNHLLERKNG